MDYVSPLLPFVQPGQPLPRQFIGPAPGNYNTNLGGDEAEFRSWVAGNRVPFNVNAPMSDYDMRGFFQAFQAGDPRATSAVDPNDSRLHYPDRWKTPSHATFSAESKWAEPGAPQWTSDDRLVSPSGRVLFDDRKKDGMTLSDILRSR